MIKKLPIGCPFVNLLKKVKMIHVVAEIAEECSIAVLQDKKDRRGQCSLKMILKKDH